MTEQPSSYSDYIGKRKTEWVKPEEIMSFFSRNNPKLSYEAFIKQEEDLITINKIIIEDTWPRPGG